MYICVLPDVFAEVRAPQSAAQPPYRREWAGGVVPAVCRTSCRVPFAVGCVSWAACYPPRGMQCGRARSQSQSPRQCCAVPRAVPPLGAAAGGGRTARCHRRHTHRAARACRRFVAWSRSLRRATIGAGVDLGGSALRRARLPLHRLRRRRRRVLHHPQMVAAPRPHLGPFPLRPLPT